MNRVNHNPQPRAHANLTSSTGDSNDDSVLVNKIINGVNSLLMAHKENVEHMTTVGSSTQPQILQDSLFGNPAMVNALPSSYTNRVWILQIETFYGHQ